jgi:glycosyltransferase involved in cell wall biosynthesis
VRIAQIAPLHESVPPQEYGGTERVVSFLTEQLVTLGHDVTLFATGDSTTAARLVAMAPRSLRTDPDSVDSLPHYILMLERLASVARQFDFLHYHVDYIHFPFSRRLGVPHLTTLHGRLDLADLHPLYDEFGDMPVVSISDAQRKPLPQAHWIGTVHHGLPRDLFAPAERAGEYLAFVGRLSPEKRVDRAIEIARRSGLPLRIAAKVDRADETYFHSEIEPLLSASHVEFLGEMGDADKGDLLRGARALVFPIDWPEPFGLVMIEAMACGTPVIAWPNGSVPEVLEDGVTGFVVSSVPEAVEAVARAATVDRRRVRERFDARFTADRMARDYVALYETLAGRASRPGVLQREPA